MGVPSSSTFLDKSWLFEIFNTHTRSVEKSFTLILPPNTVVIKEPQRVNIQKTFDNVFVDDYGPDNLEVEIKAISGTTSVFPTYQTSAGGEAASFGFGAGYTGFGNPVSNPGNVATSTTLMGTTTGSPVSVTPSGGYDGRSAFYQFRDDIIRYKDRGDFEYKELRVYDLFDAQAYKCILVEFELLRTFQTPTWYPFTIKLFVYARMDDRLAFTLPPVPLATGDVNQLLDAVNTATSWVQTAGYVSSTIRSATGTAIADVQLLTARLTTVASTAVNVVLTPLQLATKLVSDTTASVTAINAAYTNGALSQQQHATFLETAHSALHNALGAWGFAAQNQGQALASKTIIYDAGLTTVASDYSGGSNHRNPSPQSYTFSGYKTYVVGGTDTLQRISSSQLGDENLWPFIALLNNITSNAELIVNSKIYIPVLNTNAARSDQYIISSSSSYDPLGSDIAIDSDGNLLLGGNDLVTVSGPANLIQAINVRLQTEEGQLIKDTAFGLFAQVGSAGIALVNSYVQMAVKASLVQDPRIAQVENLRTMVNGDKLYITATLVVPVYPQLISLTAVV